MRQPPLLAVILAVALPVMAQGGMPTLQNPDMETAGGAGLVGWHGHFGQVTATRDTKVVHGGKASLSVQNSGSKNGCVQQLVPVTPGAKLTLRAWMRSGDGAKVTLAVQFYDEKFTWDEFVQVHHLEGLQDWTQAEKEFTVPATAVRMAIALYVDGTGQGWLDDVSLSAPGSPVGERTPEASIAPPKEPSAPRLIPGTALPGFYPDYPKAWMALHESLVQQAKQGGIEVLFLGDSLTQGWSSAGREAWEKNFAPLKAACFGIGGDKTGQVLWRLEHGELDGITPKAVVLMVGVNNLWSGINTPEEIAGGIRDVVAKLRAKLPQTRVLVLGLLPIGATPDDLGRVKVSEVNRAAAATLNDGAAVKFVDVGGKLLQAEGTLLEGAYLKDNLHLTAKGYEVLAREIAPLLKELLP